MRVTLTIDNGPTPGLTEAALAALADFKVQAAFFMVGQQIAAPGGYDLAVGVKEAGHRLGNHTWSHKTPFGIEPDQQFAVAEIARCQEVLGGLADPARLFRPYSGKGIFSPQMMSRTVWEYLAREEYSCVTWNCVPRDWEDGWVDRGIEQIRQAEWAVVVVHDIPRGDIARLDEFLDRALDEGAEFTTDFPPDCTPMWCGKACVDFDRYITEI